jgi:hypothetical protein
MNRISGPSGTDPSRRHRTARFVRVSIMLVVALFFNVTATFVHAGEEIPLLGFVAGGIAALLFARLVFLARPRERWWRRNAVTGAAFDSVKVSDFDIALVGKDLLDRARALGISLRSGGARTGPLNDADIHKLGLGELRSRLSQRAGRPVNFMIFGSEKQALRRGPGIPVR